MKKLILPMVLSSSLTVAGIVPIPFNEQVAVVEAASSFKDLPSDYHALKQIDYLVSKGVISGFEDGTFKPNQVVTRGQFAAFVARALDLKASNITFKDVKSGNSLYTEINKAATAGIIKGYKDGTFRPDLPVSRSDIAVMLDRALQLKGNYTKTVSLPYSDAGSIGGYAIESVKRMAAYGIMGSAENSNKFQPATSGTRVGTVVSIYNMLQTIASTKPVEPPQKKDTEMTAAELKAKYGEQKFAFRSRGDGEIYQTSFIDRYVSYFNQSYNTFNEYLDSEKDASLMQYRLDYPYSETIHYNGKAYRSSEFYIENIDFVDDEILPVNPEKTGDFSIDLHLASNDFATYVKDNVLINRLTNLSYFKNNKAFVEIETILKGQVDVKVSSNKLIVKAKNTVEFTAGSKKVFVNGISQELSTAVEMKNGKFMVPIRESANLLGLFTRTYTGVDVRKREDITRIEIANFPLPEDYRKN
ncbi:S-layer homology domain-containing protein (plasmid) [Cytobacillus firmus]|uniref:S-layer homology domain-containing protein n=1 Tax=Bacillaceae TaxID=186817 RepID=UPI001A8C6538|nr:MULTISPECIES: S-layer homology domain-containing protein [Bacillaceae]MBN8202539.1 S-layer homology domain-containing protein [Bacillus sp. NTK034]